MPTFSGLNAQVGIGIESTPGTAVAPTRWPSGTRSAPFTRNQTFLMSQALRSGRVIRAKRFAGKYGYTGELEVELSSADAGILLRTAIGGAVTTGAGPYTHTFTPANDLPASSVEVGTPSLAAINRFRYTGAYVQSWTLTINPEEIVRMALSYIGMDVDVTGVLSTPTYTTVDPFLPAQATLTIGGTTECFSNVTLTGTNNLSQSDVLCVATPGRRAVRDAGFHDLGGTFDQEFEDMTLYNLFVAGTAATFSLAINAGATSQLTITGSVKFDGENPKVTGPEVLKQSIPFTFMHDTSDASAFTAVLINSVSTAV